MSSTDGLVRGMDAVDTGRAINVPVGKETLGRIFNVLGEPIDELPAPKDCEHWDIHRDPPSYEEHKAGVCQLHADLIVVLAGLLVRIEGSRGGVVNIHRGNNANLVALLLMETIDCLISRFSISRTGIMLSSGMHRHTLPHGRFGLILICSTRQNGWMIF